MLTYLTGSVRPDIAMAVHQCARLSANPMRSHEQAVMRIGRYLLSTQDRGMRYTPDTIDHDDNDNNDNNCASRMSRLCKAEGATRDQDAWMMWRAETCNTIKARILELRLARSGCHICRVPQWHRRLAILRRVQRCKARRDGVALGRCPIEDGGDVRGILPGRARVPAGEGSGDGGGG